MKTHLVLISAQPVPNFTPVLDERFRPEQVIMLVSPGMLERSRALESIYKPRGVRVLRWPIDDPWDVEHIRNRVIDLLSEREEDEMVLNATGGTKPMSIAAYEVFRTFGKPVFYIHPEKDRLIWMNSEKASVNLDDRIRIAEYLKAYGAIRVTTGNRLGVPESIREMTEHLIHHIAGYAEGLAKINFYAAQADHPGLTTSDITLSYRENPGFWELIDLFSNAGLLCHENGRLKFADENARFMVNGGWLEQYTYGVCLNIKKKAGLQDIGRSLEVERRQGKQTVLNELDVALLKDNRLFIIECKTKRFSKDRKKQGEGAEVLYKLDCLRDLLGGLQARAMLASFNRIAPQHQTRARELKIKLCCHQDLKNLEEKLYEWLAS